MVSTQLTNNPQVGYFSTIDRSCDWMRDQCVESFKDERKRRRSKAPKGTEQMDGNVLLLLFDVFSFGHLLCLTLKWRHAFQERSGEICYSNKTRLPTWTFGIIPKKKSTISEFSFMRAVKLYPSYLWICTYIYIYGIKLSHWTTRCICGVICSKESLLCSFLEVSKITHLGAEIAAELTACLLVVLFDD